MADQNDSQIFSQLDAEKIERIKEETKAEAVRAAQESLISKLQGDKPKYSWEERGQSQPSNYDELFGEVEKRVTKVTPEDIDRKVEEKLQAREEAKRKEEEENLKRQHQSIEERRKSFDSEWYALVKEGKMPAPSKEVQDKINRQEQLTREEIENDPGLMERRKLASLAQNKSAKLAFYEDYNKEPVGSRAPVLGGRPSASPSTSTELDYDDVQKNRKRLFGF